jgi:hypothetical protein
MADGGETGKCRSSVVRCSRGGNHTSSTQEDRFHDSLLLRARGGSVTLAKWSPSCVHDTLYPPHTRASLAPYWLVPPFG